ncbi:hypothetical protein GCM10011318_21270 [Phaeocystidibacter marisrubri]|uniref:Homoserine dehydrogenase n=2 Tax=Phaeocystidibacter marisrubri TaxID=1577780 RepID=A0A6L3ZHP1_9FLAO|nr:homoserine dehydrogenase [Phaeocystidibacter marisrubri]GGH74849.1 hypothetical protein GCM10011318_21270 [Phaeocystidibacter marisrubri]
MDSTNPRMSAEGLDEYAQRSEIHIQTEGSQKELRLVGDPLGGRELQQCSREITFTNDLKERRMSNRSLKLGIFGFGCVGSGLYETLQASKFKRAEVVRICILDPSKPRTAPRDLFTTVPEELLDNEDIDVIVELIDDAEAAYEIVTRALRSGKDVVSANKKLVAEHLEELIQIQRETGRSFLYEAACAASIPIIRNLEEYYDNDLVQKVEGILNGSTNYILSALQNGGDFDSVLNEAQEAGYAESDPTLDVDGWDAKFKLTLLIAHSFGLVVPPSSVPHHGIRYITPRLQRIARERNQRIKLIARCWKEDDRVRAYVLPSFVDSDEELFAVNDALNGVVVEGAFSERQYFRGKGAGSLPTGAAVLSDISALTYDYRYAYKKLNSDLEFENDFPVCVHLNGNQSGPLPIYAFEEVFGTFRSVKESYVEGRIGIRNLLELLETGLWSAALLSEQTLQSLEQDQSSILAVSH